MVRMNIAQRSSTVFWMLLVSAVTSPVAVVGAKSPFRIVVDGGSTGSRLHVFEFVSNGSGAAADCVSRGSSRANTPLSSFGRLHDDRHVPLNAAHVAQHLLPLFEYASTIVPSRYHETTVVKYQATAGMRLLDQDEQDAVYDALYDGLMRAETFVFRSLQRQDIATLQGDLEGYYGAIAANYLKGVIDAKLHTKDGSPIGALDMGGSSTQIVFSQPKEPQLPDIYEPCSGDQDGSCSAADPSKPAASRLSDEDFFATSYLSYGVDQFRTRLWSTWVAEHEAELLEDTCDTKIIDNPCTFKGYKIQWEGYTLYGTGDAHKCVEEVRRLIPHPEVPHDEPPTGKVGGVQHPPVQGKFFAMSLYFFTLDSLRVLSRPSEDAHQALNLSWPNPSIQELHDALEGLCSRSWKGDLEEIQHNAHQYTRAEVLPHRCLESVYMVTLLKDGFGFHPSSRDITFTYLVDGCEVEWSLGMALTLNAVEQDAGSRYMEIRADNNNTTDDISEIPIFAPRS